MKTKFTILATSIFLATFAGLAAIYIGTVYSESDHNITNIDISTMGSNVLRFNAPLQATASVIILHGLGDSGEGWRFLSDMLHQHDKFKTVNFIFPNAPVKPLSIAGGQEVSQWFDIYEMGNPNARQDEDGYWASVARVGNWIDDEILNGIDPSKIVVGGFSQGASLSLGISAAYDKKLAGILCLSGFFNMRQGITSRLKDANKSTDIFHGHGDMDPMIRVDLAKSAAKYFKEQGFANYNLKIYPGMGHSTCEEELTDIADFLIKSLNL
jgi:predicted esterase